MPYLRLPRLRRNGPSRALRPQSPNAGLGVRRVLGKGREGAVLWSGMRPDFWQFPRQPLLARHNRAGQRPQYGLRPGRCTSSLRCYAPSRSPTEAKCQRQRTTTTTPPHRVPKADAAKSARAGFRPGEKFWRYSRTAAYSQNQAVCSGPALMSSAFFSSLTVGPL